ncbi:MAG: pyridoxamine 5'-phosphate oxidase family protein [Acidimicrobiia bacterium]
MASWSSFVASAPEFAAKARARFDATKHHVLATVRRDGSPRVSGTEVRFFDGELTLGSMPGAVKVRDLQRDPRFAIHANPGDGSMDGGDAKIAGSATEVLDEAVLSRFVGDQDGEMPDGPFHLFVLDIAEVVVTELHPDGDRLVITTWTPGGGVRTVERR